MTAGYREVTFGDLIVEYEKYKAKSNRPLGRTASFTYRIIRNYPISQLIASKIKSHDIVHYCTARKESDSQPGPATIAIDVSVIRKVLRIGKSLLGVNCTQQPVVEAYQALYDLKLIARSTTRKRRLEGNEYDRLLAFFEQKEKHRSTVIPYRVLRSYQEHNSRSAKREVRHWDQVGYWSTEQKSCSAFLSTMMDVRRKRFPVSFLYFGIL